MELRSLSSKKHLYETTRKWPAVPYNSLYLEKSWLMKYFIMVSLYNYWDRWVPRAWFSYSKLIFFWIIMVLEKMFAVEHSFQEKRNIFIWNFYWLLIFCTHLLLVNIVNLNLSHASCHLMMVFWVCYTM
jgi:hypothetical protein